MMPSSWWPILFMGRFKGLSMRLNILPFWCYLLLLFVGPDNYRDHQQK